MGGIRGGAFWRRGVSRLRPDTGDAQGGGRGDAGVRLRSLANRADDRLSSRMAISQPRPAPSVSAHRFHRRFQHVGAAGGVGQLRLRFRRPADRPADHRPPISITLARERSPAPSRPFGPTRTGRGRSRRRVDQVAMRAGALLSGRRKARSNRVCGAPPGKTKQVSKEASDTKNGIEAGPKSSKSCMFTACKASLAPRTSWWITRDLGKKLRALVFVAAATNSARCACPRRGLRQKRRGLRRLALLLQAGRRRQRRVA